MTENAAPLKSGTTPAGPHFCGAQASDLHHSFKLELNSDSIAWKTEDDDGIRRYEAEPNTSAWLRLWRKTLGGLIPEHQL